MYTAVPQEQQEIERLRDLLPATLRPVLRITVVSYGAAALIRLKPKPIWQPNGVIELDYSRWRSLPQGQRDLLFLREAGWFDSRTWLQPGLYQLIAAGGAIATVAEIAMQNPFSVVLAGGVTGLAVRQVWQNLNSDEAQYDADEFALRRAEYRGYERRAAARFLYEALEQTVQVDKTQVVNVVRLQRLLAVAKS